MCFKSTVVGEPIVVYVCLEAMVFINPFNLLTLMGADLNKFSVVYPRVMRCFISHHVFRSLLAVIFVYDHRIQGCT